MNAIRRPRRTRDDLEREACLRSFPEFVLRAWLHADARHGKEPIGVRVGADGKRRLPRHMHAVCVHLQAWALGEIDLLLINLPPGLGKSILTSVLLPAWIWARDPSEPMMFGSYSEDPSERDSDRNRRLVGSEWYQRLFVRGQWSIRKDTIDYWDNSAGGSRIIVTRTGRGTGFRGRRIVVDDGIKVAEGHSEAALTSTIEWISQTLWTRNLPGEPVRMCIIGQRVVDGDPSGWAMGTGKFVHVCLPAEYEPDRHCTTKVIDEETGLPWTDWRTEQDELLCPELHDREYLAGQKDILASGYPAQYAQDPVDPKAAMFPRSGWRFWRYDDEPEAPEQRPKGCYKGPAVVLPRLEELRIVVSMDAAFKKNPTTDRVSITVWARRIRQKVGRFLLDRRTRQMSFTESLRELKAICDDWPTYHAALVEEKANGSAIVDVLKEEGSVDRLNPPSARELVNPTDDKKTRAAAGAPEQQNGEWYLHDGAPYLGEFILEHERFPKGKKDDDVDSTSQANTFLRGNLRGGYSLERWQRMV
jgi:predicted phage terminase large subunit-like protein